MNNLERLDLVNSIALELQQRMTYRDIDAYLPRFGIDLESKPYSGPNSKWSYSKHMLADAPAATVIAIADELGIPHGFTAGSGRAVRESSYWRPNAFRLFLSHISSFKVTTRQLQKALNGFGISSFVAHVDIEPTKPWLDEIESALLSMDALAAILMPGFKESNWTDHEVGIAVGRGILVIPVMRGLTPYGFIGKYQGLNAEGKTVGQVAESIFRILVTAPATRSRMLTCLVDQVVSAQTEADAATALGLLGSVSDVPVEYAQRLKAGAQGSTLFELRPLQVELNRFLLAHGVSPMRSVQEVTTLEDDEIPF